MIGAESYQNEHIPHPDTYTWFSYLKRLFKRLIFSIKCLILMHIGCIFFLFTKLCNLLIINILYMKIDNIWLVFNLNPLKWWWKDKTDDDVISLNHAFNLYCNKCCKNEHELNGVFEEACAWTAEQCGLCLYAYASAAMCLSCGLHPWSSLSLVERVVPAMVVWLRLRTLCSRGSEISLDHIVLCLYLARCQKQQENRL